MRRTHTAIIRGKPLWTYDNPVNIQFGSGAFAQVAKAINQRPYCLVTYGEAYFDQLSTLLSKSAGEPQCIINDIQPNPDFIPLRVSCRNFADVARSDTVIVALGGGSVIDTAKVLAASNGGFDNVQHFLETKSGEGKLSSHPIIAIPTTAGTGSEVTQWATVWDVESQRKHSLSRHCHYPEVAIVDPDLTLGIPEALTVSTALDALSHSLESIWNRNGNPVSANHAIFAASEMIYALPLLLGDLGNLELRTRVSRASLFAGLAFSNTKTALAHSVSYPITLKYNVVHGLACSFSLPMIMASVIGENAECDTNLSRIFGKDLNEGVKKLDRFLKDLGVSTSAVDYGVQKNELQDLLTSALEGERGLNFIGTQERVLESFTI
ncbi:MAG: phosphonoacetaldehyde reductase [Rhizobiaceae bacterium]